MFYVEVYGAIVWAGLTARWFVMELCVRKIAPAIYAKYSQYVYGTDFGLEPSLDKLKELADLAIELDELDYLMNVDGGLDKKALEALKSNPTKLAELQGKTDILLTPGRIDTYIRLVQVMKSLGTKVKDKEGKEVLNAFQKQYGEHVNSVTLSKAYYAKLKKDGVPVKSRAAKIFDWLGDIRDIIISRSFGRGLTTVMLVLAIIAAVPTGGISLILPSVCLAGLWITFGLQVYDEYLSRKEQIELSREAVAQEKYLALAQKLEMTLEPKELAATPIVDRHKGVTFRSMLSMGLYLFEDIAATVASFLPNGVFAMSGSPMSTRHGQFYNKTIGVALDFITKWSSLLFFGTVSAIYVAGYWMTKDGLASAALEKESTDARIKANKKQLPEYKNVAELEAECTNLQARLDKGETKEAAKKSDAVQSTASLALESLISVAVDQGLCNQLRGAANGVLDAAGVSEKSQFNNSVTDAVFSERKQIIDTDKNIVEKAKDKRRDKHAKCEGKPTSEVFHVMRCESYKEARAEIFGLAAAGA